MREYWCWVQAAFGERLYVMKVSAESYGRARSRYLGLLVGILESQVECEEAGETGEAKRSEREDLGELGP